MTGRDLIVYILSNRLENEKIDENNLVPVINNYMKDDDVAAALGVGVATIKTWNDFGYFDDVFTKERNLYIRKDEVIHILSEKLKEERKRRKDA